MAINLNRDVAYRAAKQIEKGYTLTDGGGSTLLTKSSGAKS